MKISGGLGAIFRIIGGLPTIVAQANLYIADHRVTAAELISFATLVIETITGKTLDELGLEVTL